MRNWELVGAVALLLCFSAVTADDNSTTTEDFDATTTSTADALPLSNSSSGENANVSSELSINDERSSDQSNSPSSESVASELQTTQASPESSAPRTSTETPNATSVSSPVQSNLSADTNAPDQTTLASTSSESANRPATDSPSSTNSGEPTPSDEPSLTTPQVDGRDESSTHASTRNTRPNISRTPVASTATDDAASGTTFEAGQQETNIKASTENSERPSEEQTSNYLSENSNQNETATSEEVFDFHQNATATSILEKEETPETSTEVTEFPRECEMAQEGRDRKMEALHHYYLVTVILMVLMNLGFCLVTVLCVYKIAKRYNTRSWDPPPIRYGSVDYGISMGRRNMGLDLSPETHAGMPPPHRGTRDGSDGIPIVITNEDGWCVPYDEGVHSKSTPNIDEDNNQQMSSIGGDRNFSRPEELRRHSDTGL